MIFGTDYLESFDGRKTQYYSRFAKNTVIISYEIEKYQTKRSNRTLSKIELFLRAITRQFIFGNFSSESNVYLFEIEAFSDIEDNQIGKTDYRQLLNHERIKRK